MKLSPTLAARNFCLWCCNNSSSEVEACPVDTCPLWPHRFPRTHKDYPGRVNVPTLRKKCQDCAENARDIRECDRTDCALWRFRHGKIKRDAPQLELV